MNNTFEVIELIEEIGEVETYDLEIDSEFHNYYANEICVSNSHSISYAYLAMQTLFLKHYYPTEFYASLLNHTKKNGNPEEVKKWITSAIISAMSKGIEIKTPSRKSDWDWKVTGEKEISMGFSFIKGFGDIAYQELLELIEKKGKKLENISKYAFLDMPYSKFSKSSFEGMLKAGVFDDWSNSREELLELFQKSKKNNKKISPTQLNLFGASYEPELKSNEIKFKATSDFEKNKDFIDVCNFDLNFVKRIFYVKNKINEIAKRTINSIGEYHEKDYYWFILDAKIKQKTKKGKEYFLLKVSDGISNENLRMFGSDCKVFDEILEEGSVYVAELQKNDQGFMNFTKKFQKDEKHKSEIYLTKIDI